jgi:hypothetical protein
LRQLRELAIKLVSIEIAVLQLVSLQFWTVQHAPSGAAWYHQFSLTFQDLP